ncbi:unnamed protein product [Paramecium sonneborni]|uniref:E2F/DP family winged-helix DNA-binding domain-containing protein n=1 Tax=Paramecium sonneborni TaxID=65129 RepID=A0A8S1LKX6_9CILI|nr:unnamed protein product [Paramecium sonneborni]
MDFTGQFRLDEDSFNFNVFQTPVKGIIQGKIFQNKLMNWLNQSIYQRAFILALILQFDFEGPCDSQTNTNKKLFVQNEPFEISKIQFDSPKSLKKWSLKYISKRVEKELQNKIVGYSEICQKLTEEMTQEMEGHSDYGSKDIKNLRRRVYDALNVMISIGIVVKEKKMLRKNEESQVNITKQNLLFRKQKLKELLLQKKQQLTNSIKKQETLQNLVKFNKERETSEHEKIKFPFLLVKTQLTNSEDEELILESYKSMDYLKVLSKNKLQIFGILSIAQQLFQIQQSKN